jgi:hypothetical protein
VLAAPCDLLGIPAHAVGLLAPPPAVADGQWLLGLWDSADAAMLESLLKAEGAISARRWISERKAAMRPIPLRQNVNRPGDL